MTTKKKRLGRGLDALISKPAAPVENEQASVAVALNPEPRRSDALRKLPVELLQRGQYQPRVDMRQDSLEELANSIKAQGVVQPIVVLPLSQASGQVRYEIIAGERRWRAAQMAGLDEIPSVVREIDDDAAIAMALIENIQREDLNPLEEANALERLVDEFDLTHQQAADAVGRSRASVSNLLRLLELSDKVRPMLEARELEMGHARALLALSNAQQQVDAAREVVKKGLSVRATEALVRRLQSGGGSTSKPAPESGNADIRRLETEITDKLGAKVKIEHSAKGFGKLVVAYNNLDELDGILKHIQ